MLPAVSVASEKAWTKVAVSNRDAVIVSVQVVVVPLHAPPHCWKVAPEPALAVSVTIVFTGKACAQIPPQLMPAGLLVTMLVDEPRRTTWRPKLLAGALKVAVTATLPVRVSLHVGFVEQPELPAQLTKLESGSGVAASVASEPALNDCAQTAPQLSPIGSLVTPPVPVPIRFAVTVDCDGPGVTVKLLALVPVPPSVCTLIGPVVALAGTNAVTEVSVLLVKTAATPLKRTERMSPTPGSRSSSQ